MTSLHHVRRGETLGQIAREHGVSLRDLARANGIANVNQIRADSTLSIPDHFDRGRTTTAAARRNDGDTFAARAGGARSAPRSADAYSRIDSLHDFLAGGTNSRAAAIVGYSEGNRTLNGGFRASFGGHTDPGNRAHNRGSYSYQGPGARTRQQADAIWGGVLQGRTAAYQAAARRARKS